MKMVTLRIVAICVSLLFGAQNSYGNYQLIFEDTFDTLDLTKWDQAVTFSSVGKVNKEFQVYTPDAKNTFVQNGQLNIKPSLTQCNADPQTKLPFGDLFLHNGKWNLTETYGKCTESSNKGCERDAPSDGLLPPVMSGKLVTRSSFKFARIEVVAKMPSGDWIYPSVQLIPETNAYGAWPRSGEIDIVELRGNRKLTDNGTTIASDVDVFGLHWGASDDMYKLTSDSKIRLNDSLSENFHTYYLDWTEKSIKFSIDNEVVGEFPDPQSGKTWQGFFRYGVEEGGMDNSTNPWKSSSSLMAPFDQNFRLVLGVGVGGTSGFFPDDAVNNDNGEKPWRDSMQNATAVFWSRRSEWFRSWDDVKSAMQVKSVRVYQIPPPTTTPSPTTTPTATAALLTPTHVLLFVYFLVSFVSVY